MTFPVIKAAGYILVHAPNIMMEHGTTITMERKNNPDSDYLQKTLKFIRTFEEAVNYAPNQVYIGNLTPEELQTVPQPWYQNLVAKGPDGKYGDIIPENEFYAVMKIADSFQLVELEQEFAARIKKLWRQKKCFT